MSSYARGIAALQPASSGGNGGFSMDPLSFFGNLFGGFGQMVAGQQQARASRYGADKAHETALEQLDFQREAGLLGMEGTEWENRQRQREAGARAAKLEDVAGMFQNFLGEGFGSGAPGGNVTAAGVRGNAPNIRQMSNLQDLGNMREIAAMLQNQDGSVDMRRAAMRELDRSSDAVNAAMAQAGVRGSGFAAGQQRQLAGDVLSGLARDISQQRLQALQGAGSLYGQAGNLDFSRRNANLGARTAMAQMANQRDITNAQLQNAARIASASNQASNYSTNMTARLRALENIGNVYSDESFGIAGTPYEESPFLDRYRKSWGGEEMYPELFNTMTPGEATNIFKALPFGFGRPHAGIGKYS